MEEWIKKSDVIKALNTEARKQFRLDDSYAYVIGTLRNVEDAISNIPSTDRPQGEWKNYKDEHLCSNCGEVVIDDWYDTYDWYDFCPHCGARMKGADDETAND